MRRIAGCLAVSVLATVLPAAGQTPDPAAGAQRIDREAHGTVFDLLRVPEAWELTRGGPECLVGVIDGGFDFFHPALRGHVIPGYFADAVYHTDAVGLIAHGTMVTSVIVAQNVEAGGAVGLAPECRIVTASRGTPEHKLLLLQQRFHKEHPQAGMAEFANEMAKHAVELQTFGAEWLEYVTRTAAQGIRYLSDRSVRVINVSEYLPRQNLSRYPGLAERMDSAFVYAAERDVLIVIGAGNNGQWVEDYPGTAEAVLVVGASTLADERWEMTVSVGDREVKQGSNYGPRLSIVAPMENLLVAVPHDEAFYAIQDSPLGAAMDTFDGAYRVIPFGATSLATAVASSLAALVRSLRPDLSASEVVRVMKAGAVDVGAPGVDEMTGHGRIDFRQTLELARDWGSTIHRPGSY
jgi:thermitase